MILQYNALSCIITRLSDDNITLNKIAVSVFDASHESITGNKHTKSSLK